MKGMDMNHSKGWKGRHQAEANGYAQGSCKEGMEMDHSKEGMKRTTCKKKL
jgi:hypothetical protein